jgi:hypothetical protein
VQRSHNGVDLPGSRRQIPLKKNRETAAKRLASLAAQNPSLIIQTKNEDITPIFFGSLKKIL